MTERIKILFLASNPVDALFRPRLDQEAREIGEKIRAGTYRDMFEMNSCWAVRTGDVARCLLDHTPRIIHFSGHGGKTEGLVFEDNDGNMKPVSKQAIIHLFSIFKDNVRLVFLNACHGRRQIDALREVIDFTIAMNTSITDEAALIFAPHFYQGLAFGRSVREAFELGVAQLEMEGIKESKVPELLVREGVDASKVYFAEAQHQMNNDRESGRPQSESPSKPTKVTEYKDISNSIVGNKIKQKEGGIVAVTMNQSASRKRKNR